ncbi:MAG: hypothetical protein HKN51_12115 [Saprospiraceae bacterium]|nr:hypothetical protein [Saprospiraceae bacterium]
MKQFKLKEKKTFIKILKEPPVEKKKTNVSRIVYLLILFFVLTMVVKRIYNGNVTIFADGQIELPKQTINFPNDIKVIDIYTEEGKTVCEGDTLFKYKILRDEIDQANLESKNQENSWIIKERLSINKKIELNKILISNKSLNLKQINSNINTSESLLLGGLHSEYNQYSHLKDVESKIRSEILYLKEEIKLLLNHLNLLIRNQQNYLNSTRSTSEIYNRLNYFIASIDGVISDVFYEENEICFKKEEMLTIHQLKDASVITYFDTNEMDHLNVGDEVSVLFPDGNVQQGRISKFFVSTYALPSEFQKKYEPTERNIVAQVVPQSTADEKLWQKFYKMNVRVEKSRYNLF